MATAARPAICQNNVLADFLRYIKHYTSIGMEKPATIAAINSGSSSLKFRLFSSGPDRLREMVSGKITGIGTDHGLLTITPDKGRSISRNITVPFISDAANLLADWLVQQPGNDALAGIGHRVVHGGLHFSEPERITPAFLSILQKLVPMAPLHLPDALTVMSTFQQAFPNIPQVASFDTHFHRGMPFEAKHFALPRTLWTEGILRYGFHGLSCQYIVDQVQLTTPLLSTKKMIIAHLGSGSSMTAVKNKRSIETTMGFTPAGGLVMTKRPGDLDPGVILYLLEQKQITLGALQDLLTAKAGLTAIAGTDASIPELLEKEQADSAAREAITLFCYHAKKQMGALAAAMGGLDIIVFTGGIGEHQPVIRERICEGLEFLGIRLDKTLNEQSAVAIGDKNSNVAVYVIPANEELVIANIVWQSLRFT